MTLYSHNLNTPEPLPEKIVLSNGFTRTDPDTFTDAEIADAGYVAAPAMPDYNNKTHKCLWVNTEWVTSELNDEEKADVKEAEWLAIQQAMGMQFNCALLLYREMRNDVDAGNQPMYLVSDVNAWIAKLEMDYVYGTYNENTGQFTIAGFDWDNTNPDWVMPTDPPWTPGPE